jgi:hemoglobin
MRDAVDELELPPELEKMLWDYFTMAARSMVNAPS